MSAAISRAPKVDFGALLTRTSRTFALAIRFLPEPLRTDVTLAYLLLRVADTLEDASLWTPDQRVAALDDFGRLVRDVAAGRTPHTLGSWVYGAGGPPTRDASCVELVRATPELFEAVRAMDRDARAVLMRHVPRTVQGMAWFQRRSGRPGPLVVRDLQDLRAYCYVVAGIVGELLTELFLVRCPHVGSPAGELWRHAASFGEGLQLVNVLKDERADALEGRTVLPSRVDRTLVRAIAARDLEAADAYVAALRQAKFPRGVIAFCWLPVRLARATLGKVAREGAGAKISRDEVAQHLEAVERGSDV